MHRVRTTAPTTTRAWRAIALLVVALLFVALLGACARSPAPVRFHADGSPRTLAEWGVLQSDGTRLRLAGGVLPYDLNTPLFSDYAHKLRTVWMPAGTAAQYRADDSFAFPVGTIISKTFYYPRAGGAAAANAVLKADATPDERIGDGLDLTRVRMIETRLLVRREGGWAALAYVWNDAQTEAVLSRAGASLPLQLVAQDGGGTDFTYQVPDQNQCAGCHASNNTTRAIAPIGAKARHLHRDYAYANGSAPQLQRWQQVGYLTGAPAAAATPRNADWRDGARASLDARARAYLDINCGHCHNARGPADTSGLLLDSSVVSTRQLGICKPPVAAGQGTGDHTFDIVPGQPAQSILVYRMRSLDPGAMMPELGRDLIHEEGVALVSEWIGAQNGRCDSET
ncbi:SO2930 family diheme c-type cytochrome [Montanilutibacter psychrotolerans]|uniref:SO2930 family diheme c-type cytochrome n=1 Tax=Montanilutibacter psychrotolerans TaxID=1327343 RepID=UPI001CC21BB9|nr:SO2930 family diheme c-type cytochrome [Lysobacter psychrotolerans]